MRHFLYLVTSMFLAPCHSPSVIRRIAWRCFFLISCGLPLPAMATPSVNAATVSPVPPPVLAAKTWILTEFPTGQVLTEEQADIPRAPASLTKLMTAYLTFSALRQKTLARETLVTVSKKAWQTGGSRMFIKVGDKAPVDALLKGMIIQSGNDAGVALAEAIAGRAEAVAAMMNRKAEQLGMKNSRFVNATGLPDPAHTSTARDLSRLAHALIQDFPDEYARYYAQKEYFYNNIRQLNRNRLLWLDSSVDGVKTGSTAEAGFCLIASSSRGGRRLISVLMGAATDQSRAGESLKLLNWGYQAFEATRLYAGGKGITSFRVWKGDKSAVNVGFQNDFVIAVPRPDGSKQLAARLVSHQPLVAPVRKGQVIGALHLSLAGRSYGEYPVHALEDIAPGGLLSRLFDSIRLWFSKHA
jgi:D-alanyl-D-alanine carboxypeptidase (penicillin-binding protein 5/6)